MSKKEKNRGNIVYSTNPNFNPDNNQDDDDNEEEDNDNDDKEDICDFNLNDIEGMSEYKLLCLQRIHRHNAKLVSLSLLAPMTSAASSSADRPNRKKRGAPQDDVERRVQPKRKAKQPTSYRNQES